MAQPFSRTYSVGVGRPIVVGKVRGGAFVGALTADDATLAGALGSAPSAMSGALVAGDATVASAMVGDLYIKPPLSMVARTAAVIGDSLTEEAYGATPWYWMNAMSGAPFQLIQNSGHAGQSISGLIGQIDLDWIDLSGGPMGLAGMPTVGWIFLRIGTNTARGAAGSTGVPIDGGAQADYNAVIAKLLLQCEHLVLLPVPPIGGYALAKNTAVAGYNAYLKSLVLADATGRLHWIDDCADLVDASGNILNGYFNPSDELHFYPPAQYQAALTAQPQIAALLANQSYSSQLSTSAADVYPAQPQWIVNHMNAGSGGSVGAGFTGTLPLSMVAGCTGGNAGALSIVAADAGDPNTTPWLRVTMSSCVSGGEFQLGWDCAGRTVTSSDPQDIETLAQIRFNNVDATKVGEIKFRMLSGPYELPKPARLQFGGVSSLINRTVTLQKKQHRKDTNASTPTANYCQILTSATGTAVGSIDIRCHTNRG